MKRKQLPVSCLPVSLFQRFFNQEETVLSWASYAAELGLDYIDMNRKCFLDMTVEEAKQAREKLAVPVMMVTTYSDFTNPDSNGLKMAIEDAKNDIKLSAAIGAKYIRLTAGQGYPDQPEHEMVDRIYHCFEECLPVAKEAGIRLLLENHSKPGAWQYPDFDFHFDRMLMLWEKIKDLPIGINFDTANGYAVGNWRALVDAFGERIETIHINDLESIIPLKFGCVGEGIVPQTNILRAIWRYDFRGPVCIEEACMRGREGIETAYKNTKQILEHIQW